MIINHGMLINVGDLVVIITFADYVGEIHQARYNEIIKIKGVWRMLLSRIQRRQLFLGVTIFTLSALAQAIFVSKVKVETVPSQKMEMPAPVMEAGCRLFAGDPKKNEFYILSKGQADPIIKKVGPAFVNTQPMQEGIDADTLLRGQPSQAIVDVSNVFTEEFSQTNADANVQAEQANQANQDKTDSNGVSASMEKRYFDVSVPDDTERLTPREQKANDTNLSKVKNLLHNLTRKIVDKKKHSRVKMAAGSKSVSKLHAANARHAKHARVNSKHGRLNTRQAWHSVAIHKGMQHKSELAVLKPGYIKA